VHALYLAAGSLVAGFGVLVTFAGQVWLLAGYSGLTSPTPGGVVRDTAGTTLLRTGIVVTGFGVPVSVTDPPSYHGLLVVATRLVVIVYSPVQRGFREL